ncbi:MAG TPA: hypothetical protein RMH99_13635 [Sandaracinaceae bacterium LLY-WYZ-13_1]|nr:hypothetical protein [Sandaracinaceae bacterium LLY-WYZ-13_1]
MTRRLLATMWTAAIAALAGCGEEAPGPAADDARDEAAPVGERAGDDRADARDPGDPGAGDPGAGRPEGAGEPTRLNVPPRTIHRARREAAGLYRMPSGLRGQVLGQRRAEHETTYTALRADPDAHADEGVSFEGRVGLVRSAGPRLWVMALHTRREGARWTDPLYVLSVVPPQLPPDGGAEARVHGWVVGERTIGRHALPLLVAYHVERLDEAADDGAQ